MSNQIAKFIVEGTPVSKQRPRVTTRGFTYTPKKTTDHEHYIRDCFRVRCPKWKLTDKKLSVNLTFYFKPAKSTPKKRLLGLLGTFCDNNKDLDNLIKTVYHLCKLFYLSYPRQF